MKMNYLTWNSQLSNRCADGINYADYCKGLAMCQPEEVDDEYLELVDQYKQLRVKHTELTEELKKTQNDAWSLDLQKLWEEHDRIGMEIYDVAARHRCIQDDLAARNAFRSEVEFILDDDEMRDAVTDALIRLQHIADEIAALNTRYPQGE